MNFIKRKILHNIIFMVTHPLMSPCNWWLHPCSWPTYILIIHCSTCICMHWVDPHDHQRIQVVEIHECSAYVRQDVMVMCPYKDTLVTYGMQRFEATKNRKLWKVVVEQEQCMLWWSRWVRSGTKTVICLCLVTPCLFLFTCQRLLTLQVASTSCRVAPTCCWGHHDMGQLQYSHS